MSFVTGSIRTKHAVYIRNYKSVDSYFLDSESHSSWNHISFKQRDFMENREALEIKNLFQGKKAHKDVISRLENEDESLWDTLLNIVKEGDMEIHFRARIGYMENLNAMEKAGTLSTGKLVDELQLLFYALSDGISEEMERIYIRARALGLTK